MNPVMNEEKKMQGSEPLDVDLYSTDSNSSYSKLMPVMVT
jgi:hypothetical protein